MTNKTDIEKTIRTHLSTGDVDNALVSLESHLSELIAENRTPALLTLLRRLYGFGGGGPNIMKGKILLLCWDMVEPISDDWFLSDDSIFKRLEREALEVMARSDKS